MNFTNTMDPAGALQNITSTLGVQPVDVASVINNANSDYFASAGLGSGAANMPGTFGNVGGGGLTTGQYVGLGLGGLQTIGNLLASFKSLSLANKQFNFQKDFATKNMANQVATYNTALADRARSRAAMESQTPDQAQAYIDKNKLTGIGG